VSEVTVTAPAARLDRFLADCAGISRSQAQQWIKRGRVALNGAQADASAALRTGDRVAFEAPAPAAAGLTPEAIPLAIVFEDEHLVVVNKPAGMVVHPAAGHATGTLVHALLHHSREWSTLSGARRPGIVHRLDKDTSGLLVVARNDRAHQGLARQLANRTMHREYVAVCVGVPSAPRARIEAPVGRHPRHRQRMAVVAGGRLARTDFVVEERYPSAASLRVVLESGRTHQIRVHLAYIGHPVLGDTVYGRPAPGLIDRPALHAERLRFQHPLTGAALRFRAPLPEDLKILRARLRDRG
jgi:23S rRNA pseudouridine1911/1915/1917 synthase